MSDYLTKYNHLPYIIEEKGILTKIGETFVKLSGFSQRELLNHSLLTVWNDLLRINVDSNLIDTQQEAFLFTKSLDVKVVNIKKQMYTKSDTFIYTFLEKPNSRLDKKSPYLAYLHSKGDNGVAIYSAPDLRLLRANQIYLNFLDKPFNEANNSIGRSVYAIINGFRGSVIEEKCIDVLKTGEIYDVTEMPYKGYDRGMTYWNMTVVPIYEDGVIQYLAHTACEITESVLNKKQIEEQSRTIKQQKEELETIIQSMSDGVIILDKDEKICLMNKEAKKYFSSQTTFNQIRDGYKNTKYYYLDGNEIPYEQMPGFRAFNGEIVRECKIIVKHLDKEYITVVAATPILDETKNISKVILNIHDITDLVFKERKLTEQKEELEAIIENMDAAVIIYDKENNHYIDNKIVRDYISSVNGYINAKFYDFNDEEIPYEQLPFTKILVEGKAVKDHKIKMVEGDTVKYINVSGRPIYDIHNNIRLKVIVYHDITGDVKKELIIKHQQEQLLKKEIELLESAMKLKDEFLYLITHEFRTPMAVVNSALQAMELMYKNEMTENIDRYLKIIKQNTNRQLRLVNNLLDITRCKRSSKMIRKWPQIDHFFCTMKS